MKRFAQAGMWPEHVADLTVLARQRGRGVGPVRRAGLVEFLVALAPTEEVAALCALVSLRSELEWMSRLSTRGPVGPEEAEADAVAVAWEVVTTERSDAVPIRQAAVVNAIWTQLRRSAGLRRRVLLDVVPLAQDFDQADPEIDRLERWPGLLAAAVARGVLTPRQVALIARTRMDRRPLSEVATALGRPYDAVRKERRRAESALRQFAQSYFSSEEA
jgi:hypothetical protein